MWRLLRLLIARPGSQINAAVAGWDRPISLEAMLLASVWSAWTGEQHPLMPDTSGRSLTDAESRLADLALENMNRR